MADSQTLTLSPFCPLSVVAMLSNAGHVEPEYPSAPLQCLLPMLRIIAACPPWRPGVCRGGGEGCLGGGCSEGERC
ncbi:hypothetical protein E2C01_010073 [Portunus trituberculatus]|uniref:Uncharacterized protein n=1 Tax=Portunus trituberculatus TaxID=210409 RepID=A0A5B7D7I9_PORTR|nr:hypothetical protein [Portunus trituberculatus]